MGRMMKQIRRVIESDTTPAALDVYRYDLELIEWFDSMCIGDGWQSMSRADAITRPFIICSAGWVVNESDDVIMIAPHVAPPDEQTESIYQASGMMAIPKVAVRRRIVLIEGEKTEG